MVNNGTLSAAEREFVREPRFAVLATIGHDGTPQQTVIWYDLRGDQIMMNTTADRVKMENILRDPRVSICIPDGYRFVTIRGRVVDVIEDQKVAVDDILSLAVRYYPGTTKVDHGQYTKMKRRTLLVDIERVVSHGM